MGAARIGNAQGTLCLYRRHDGTRSFQVAVPEYVRDATNPNPNKQRDFLQRMLLWPSRMRAPRRPNSAAGMQRHERRCAQALAPPCSTDCPLHSSFPTRAHCVWSGVRWFQAAKGLIPLSSSSYVLGK
eukprot:scaffold281525_cov32-Tisochrysis_lutea.AAC.2